MTAISWTIHYSLSILIFMITIHYYHIVNKKKSKSLDNASEVSFTADINYQRSTKRVT